MSKEKKAKQAEAMIREALISKANKANTSEALLKSVRACTPESS